MSSEGTPTVPAAAPAAVPTPAPAPAPAPVAVATPEPAAPAPAPAAAPPAGDPPKWALERIDRLTADLRETERRLAAAGTPPAPAAAPAVPPIPATPALPVAEIERRANELSEARQFQSTLTNIASEGLKAHPTDWATTVHNLQRINALDPDIISVASSLGNPHELIYSLGKDMNEAARIASLPASQKGAAIAQFQARLKTAAAATVSGAPAPIPEGVGGNSPSTDLNDNMSMDAWADKRKKSGRWAR